MNNLSKPRSYINMTTKGPLCKQIIVSMCNDSMSNFMKSLDEYMTNINQALKGVKLDNFVDFIHSNYQGLIVNSNKVTLPSDFLVVEIYIKNLNSMNIKNIQNT